VPHQVIASSVTDKDFSKTDIAHGSYAVLTTVDDEPRIGVFAHQDRVHDQALQCLQRSSGHPVRTSDQPDRCPGDCIPEPTVIPAAIPHAGDVGSLPSRRLTTSRVAHAVLVPRQLASHLVHRHQDIMNLIDQRADLLVLELLAVLFVVHPPSMPQRDAHAGTTDQPSGADRKRSNIRSRRSAGRRQTRSTIREPRAGRSGIQFCFGP
jgi:hypothetical protein